MKDLWWTVRYEIRTRIEDRLYRWLFGTGRTEIGALAAGLAEFRRYAEERGKGWVIR